MHLAHAIPYKELVENLDSLVESGHVAQQVDAVSGLHLYNYTEKCTYEQLWNKYTLAARGLIVDPMGEEIVATPFPKFFNYGELGDSLEDLNGNWEVFQVFEKLDGSMVTIFWDARAERWRCATRGSFVSEQAQWAQREIEKIAEKGHWDKGTTYLCEAIYKANKIVVNYDYEGLVALGAYLEDGEEMPWTEVRLWAANNGMRVAEEWVPTKLENIIKLSESLSKDEEGFVVRFDNGERVKIKGAEYCRIHKLIASMTPLSVWEALVAGDDLEKWRQQLPEEMWEDFDFIRDKLWEKLSLMKSVVEDFGIRMGGVADRDLGMYLNGPGKSLAPGWGRKFIWGWRKYGGWDAMWGVDKVRTALLKEIRPDGNVL